METQGTTRPCRGLTAFDVDTVVAIATPLGQGGLGVVRLSGSRAISIANSIFQRSSNPPSSGLSSALSHTLHHGFIRNRSVTIDEVVIGLFRSPHSYTGEDVIEISCHGGPLILRDVLEVCQAWGARLAEPGEFTKRAYLNGRMDLAQAEAVADLISSRSGAARRLALNQLQGGLTKAIAPIKSSLTDLLAGLEANLDFVEEDIPPVPRDELLARLVDLKDRLDQFISGARSGRILRDGARVVLVGKPNAGKSSLFNRLVHFERSIVTEVPGTTRDTLEENIEVNGFGMILVDTAGWRPTVDPVETKGISRTEAALDTADGVLFVIDSSRPLEEEDRKIAQRIATKQAVAVLNKSDLPRSFEDRQVTSFLGEEVRHPLPTVAISSKTGDGIQELKSFLAHVFCGGGKEAPEALTVTNIRHLTLLAAAREAVEKSREATLASLSEECISLELKRALTSLGEITGESVQEDVLNAIFSKFCIGK